MSVRRPDGRCTRAETHASSAPCTASCAAIRASWTQVVVAWALRGNSNGARRSNSERQWLAVARLVASFEVGPLVGHPVANIVRLDTSDELLRSRRSLCRAHGQGAMQSVGRTVQVSRVHADSRATKLVPGPGPC